MTTIRTNNVPRDILHFHDLTKFQQQELIDCMGVDSAENWAGFIYKGNVCHLGDYMRVGEGNETFKDWHGYASDSYFSGTLIKIVEGGERVIVGWYCS